MSFESRLMCQGMRCGHLEGSSRVGSYVQGEECMQLDAGEIERGEAGYGKPLTPMQALAWINGYEYGYKLGAEGETLPDSVRNAELP